MLSNNKLSHHSMQVRVGLGFLFHFSEGDKDFGVCYTYIQ